MAAAPAADVSRTSYALAKTGAGSITTVAGVGVGAIAAGAIAVAATAALNRAERASEDEAQAADS
jgi:hypothetical protein